MTQFYGTCDLTVAAQSEAAIENRNNRVISRIYKRGKRF